MNGTTVLTQDLYQGTVVSSPLPWQAGATTVTAACQLSDADGGNAQNTLTLTIEMTFDGGKTWQSDGAATWAGGVPPKGATSGPPWQLPALSLGFSSSQSFPTHCRVRLELPATLSVGATLAFA